MVDLSACSQSKVYNCTIHEINIGIQISTAKHVIVTFWLKEKRVKNISELKMKIHFMREGDLLSILRNR